MSDSAWLIVRLEIGKIFNQYKYEQWVDENKSRFTVDSNGIYQFPSKSGHYNDSSAFGWVDRSAHTALYGGNNTNGVGYYVAATYDVGDDQSLKDYWYSQTSSLLKSSSKISAGFLKFFFDQVSLPVSFSSEQAIDYSGPPSRYRTSKHVSATAASIQRVSSNQGWDPAIYGDTIVWESNYWVNDNHIVDIHMKNLATGVESSVTPPDRGPYSPDICDNIVVWQENMTDENNNITNTDIFMKDLNTGIISPITVNSADQYIPVVYGDTILWTDYRNEPDHHCSDIYMKDLSTGIESAVTTELTNAYRGWQTMFGNIIVWMDDRNGNDDIYMKDLSTGIESAVTTDPSDQRFPDIYGNIIVWEDHRNGGGIYMKNLETGIESQVSSTSDYQHHPKIYDKIIVWEDAENIRMKNLVTGVESAITTDKSQAFHMDPVIYGKTIVWEELIWAHQGEHYVCMTKLQ